MGQYLLTAQQALSVILLVCVGGALYWLLVLLTNRLLRFLKNTHHKKFHEGRIATIRRVTVSSGVFIICTIIGGMILREFRVDPTPILASAGVLGLAISVGAQSLIKDVFAGLFILIENQYDEGDHVALSGISGCVEELTLRKTIIRDEQGVLHHIANGTVQIASVFPKKKL